MKRFILFVGLKILKHFHICSLVKMIAHYAEIGRVGKLKADFRQVSFDQIFSVKFTILLRNINNWKSAKKTKNYFLR